MLDKIWRFLKQLIQRLFGINPKIEPTPPPPPPTLTDAEYEAKLMELLEGVNQGWGRGDVAGFLIAKQIKNGDLAAWLRRFGVRSLEGAQGSTASTDAVVSLQKLARRLELLGRVAGGELGEVAGNVGREILVKFPLVSDEDFDIEGEIAFLDKALKIIPDYHEAWYARGIALSYLEKFLEAISSFDKALELKLDDEASWYNRGRALDKLGRLEEAIASYDKALEFKPDDGTAWLGRGLALDKSGRLEEAITSYDKAIEFIPDSHAYWYNWRMARVKLGRLKELIASFDKALKFKPDLHAAYYRRGIALNILERLEESIASFDKALEIKPDDYASWFNRGVILRNQPKLSCVNLLVS